MPVLQLLNIPDHKVFNAKTALYIACTNSLLIMGFNYEV